MENQIICPNCKTVISNNSIIDDAAAGVGETTRNLICENCERRISYWDITALLREQESFMGKLKNLFRKS